MSYLRPIKRFCFQSDLICDVRLLNQFTRAMPTNIYGSRPLPVIYLHESRPNRSFHSQVQRYSKGVKVPTVEKQSTEENIKRNLQGGVTISDVVLGSGTIAKSGKTVTVYYSGKLEATNKLFDAMTSGSGLTFRLGKREVIDGWDIGLVGMKVGGRRIITCPPNMAYGAKGYPPKIPPNSTLVFEVELKAVK